MRKLLVLMLVLSFASASYGSYGDIRDNFELDLRGSVLYLVGKSTTAIPSASVYDETATVCTMSNGQILGTPQTAGDGANIILYSGAGYDGFDFSVVSSGLPPEEGEPPDVIALGDWFSVDVTNLSVGDIVNVYGPYPTLLGTMEVLPEPMTIALLGLGGLFLRRRK